MHRYLVFDLDGTLAPIFRGSSEATARALRRFEREGRTIVLCSGKPTFYLNGYARQLGLRRPVLIGETGAEIVYGIALPPEKYFLLPCAHAKRRALKELSDRIEDAFGSRVWLQPNRVEVTPFFRDDRCSADLDALLLTLPHLLDGIDVYRAKFCYDFLPSEISKKAALAFFAQAEGASPRDFVTVGDGVNDLPMCSFGDCSIGVGPALRDHVSVPVNSIGEAIAYIRKNL